MSLTPLLLATLLALTAVLAPAVAQEKSARAAYQAPPWLIPQGGDHDYKPQYRPAAVPNTARCDSAAVGQALGTLVGGALGRQIAGGEGRTRASIGGAVSGVLVEGDPGRRIGTPAQACVAEVLEFAPVNARVQWAQGAVQYAVVPGDFQYLQGSYCRPFRLEVQARRGRERAQGTACRRPDGVWLAH